jgi:hypothetical protein
MTSRIRFADALDVFAAFPMLDRFAAKPPGSVEPLAYAEALIASTPFHGLAFLAHLLPRREAVWWGCQCVRAVQGDDEGVRLALQWVRDPDERTRREALDFAQAGLGSPGSWLARAAGYSGGSVLAPDQPATPAPPEACAQAVHAALITATTTLPPLAILPWMRACGEAGVRFAQGEDAKVIAPRLQVQASPQ